MLKTIQMGENLFASYCHLEIPLKFLCIFAFKMFSCGCCFVQFRMDTMEIHLWAPRGCFTLNGIIFRVTCTPWRMEKEKMDIIHRVSAEACCKHGTTHTKSTRLPLGCEPSTCTLSDVHAFAYDLAFVLVNILKTDLNAICFSAHLVGERKLVERKIV